MDRLVEAKRISASPRAPLRQGAAEWWLGGGARFPSRYRLMEVASVAVFGWLAAGLTLDVLVAVWERPMLLWGVVPTTLLGYLAADFSSGLVHWLADSYWRRDTPFWGPKFLAPFREHHVDPLAITRHDFIEANCDNCLIALLVLVPAHLWLPTREQAWATLVCVGALVLALSVLLTSIAHGWAHMATPPVLVARLQRWGVVLSAEHHAHHHESPHKTHYCITSGWLNPLLDRTRFFRRMERVLDRLGAPRAEHD